MILSKREMKSEYCRKKLFGIVELYGRNRNVGHNYAVKLKKKNYF